MYINHYTDLMADYRSGPLKFVTHDWNHHNSFLASVQVILVPLLLILCASKWYVECLYRHILLEDTYTYIKVTRKNMHVWSSSHNSRMHG